jgi:UDP-GlcNAc:undecaprenyl-phosphate GlcNAc-1-phosphate transferase
MVFLVRNSKTLSLVDIPNSRSVHVDPTSKAGGIGIFLSFTVSISLFYSDFFLSHIALFLSLLSIFLVGLYDDIKDAKPRLKFVIIILCITFLFFLEDIQIKSLGSWFGYSIDMPIAISLAFTIFAVTGYTNAMNLMDGLDGLAGGISLVIFLSFLYLGFKYHDDFVILVSAFMSFAILGFLLFNWHPSKIFMGDSGSLVLGFTISIVAIKLIEYINVVSVLFLASLPILDTIMVMVRRLQRGISPFLADRSHIHHKLVRWKTKVDYTVMLIILIQISFSLLGILLVEHSNVVNMLIYIIILYIFFHIFDDRRTPRKQSGTMFENIKLVTTLISSRYSYILIFLLLVALLFFRSIFH